MRFVCKCGESHAVLLRDFNLEGREIEPQKLVRLKCTYHYEKLEAILKSETELKIEAEFTGWVQRLLGKIWVKYITWKLNRKMGG